ncbi:MAG: DNA mismatch repair protein MutH [Myxococcales bacterium]|nr:DNA mismatch repair protein MutH [Myxococcales bacterium]
MDPVAAPRTEHELLARARALEGRTLGDIAADLSASVPDDPVHAKGKLGTLVERALGADGQPGKAHDFTALRVELKTVPVSAEGHPVESTYVCTLSLTDADAQEWETSWARAKLSRVLWVPVDAKPRDWRARVVRAARLWSPSPDEEATLRGDFDEIVGIIGVGRIEELTAHVGVALQVRPKARDGSVRTRAFGAEGEAIETIPRGLYLRTSFTGAILRGLGDDA